MSDIANAIVSKPALPTRLLGIRARIKETKNGAASPTQVCMVINTKVKLFDLKTDQDELNFIRGKFPVEWRGVDLKEDLSGIPAGLIQWEPFSVEEHEGKTINSTHLTNIDKKLMRAVKVVSKFDGLAAGDTVVMSLGFGDELAYALARQGGKLSVPATVHRIPPVKLCEYRKAKKIDNPEFNKSFDAKLLTELFLQSAKSFYPVKNRDGMIMVLRLKYKQFVDTQKARIACEQRLIQRLHSEMYLSDLELYPEGAIEEAFRKEKANDNILQGLITEEKKRKGEMEGILEQLDVYTQVFKPIEGCGPSIAARLISCIQDIKRFHKASNLKAYCGVHVKKGGKYKDVAEKNQYPRRTVGETANWIDDARKALYLFLDQANRRPDSEWGKQFRKNKVNWAALHPEASKMEIHTAGKWRTASQFIVSIYQKWKALEKGQQTNAASA